MNANRVEQPQFPLFKQPPETARGSLGVREVTVEKSNSENKEKAVFFSLLALLAIAGTVAIVFTARALHVKQPLSPLHTKIVLAVSTIPCFIGFMFGSLFACSSD